MYKLNTLRFVLVIALILFIFSSNIASADEAVIFSCSLSDSDSGASFNAARACDTSGATTQAWLSANSVYPHWIQLNFTTTFNIHDFIITWDSIDQGIPSQFEIQIFNGTSWNPVQTFMPTCPPTPATPVYLYALNNSFNTDKVRINGVSGCSGNFMGIVEVKVSTGPPIISFVVPATISVIGWLLGLIALALFIFGAWKFPLSIFVSGLVTIFLGLQLFSETHSIIISSFVWLLGIFVILFGIWRVKGDLD